MAIETTLKVGVDTREVDKGLEKVEQGAKGVNVKMAGLAAASVAAGVVAGKVLKAAAAAAVEFGKDVVEASEELGYLRDRAVGLRETLVESIAGGIDNTVNIDAMDALLERWHKVVGEFGGALGVAIGEAINGSTVYLEKFGDLAAAAVMDSLGKAAMQPLKWTGLGMLWDKFDPMSFQEAQDRASKDWGRTRKALSEIETEEQRRRYQRADEPNLDRIPPETLRFYQQNLKALNLIHDEKGKSLILQP